MTTFTKRFWWKRSMCWSHDREQWSLTIKVSKFLINGKNSTQKLIRSLDGFALVMEKLVSCCRLLWVCSVNSLIMVPLYMGCCTFTFKLVVFEWLCIPNMVTGVLSLLFPICNDFAFGVIVPTKATISPWTTLPEMGPGRGALLYFHQNYPKWNGSISNCFEWKTTIDDDVCSWSHRGWGAGWVFDEH